MVSQIKTAVCAAIAASCLVPSWPTALKAEPHKVPPPLTGDALLVDRGLNLARHGQKEQADREFRQIKELDKIADLNAIYVADNYIKLSKLDIAMKLLDRVLDHPTQQISAQNKAYAYRCRALANNGLGNLPEAIRDYKKAAEYDKRLRSENLAKAALLLSKQKRYDEALKLLDESVKSSKASGTAGDPVDFYYRGNCLQSLGRYKEALNDYTTSLVISNSYKKLATEQLLRVSYCLSERAKCYDKLGQKALAAADRKKQAEICDPIENDLFGKAKYSTDAHAEMPPMP